MDDDLSIFFDPADGHVVHCLRTRTLADDEAFHAVIGIEDEEALQGRVLAGRRVIAYPGGPDVRDGDALTVTALFPAQAAHAGTYRVQGTPRRANDGAELRAVLVLTSATPTP